MVVTSTIGKEDSSQGLTALEAWSLLYFVQEFYLTKGFVLLFRLSKMPFAGPFFVSGLQQWLACQMRYARMHLHVSGVHCRSLACLCRCI